MARSARDTQCKHHRIKRICKGKKEMEKNILSRNEKKEARKSQRNRRSSQTYVDSLSIED